MCCNFQVKICVNLISIIIRNKEFFSASKVKERRRNVEMENSDMTGQILTSNLNILDRKGKRMELLWIEECGLLIA